MKKILLLVDSIRKGYDKYVKIAFGGVAEVYFPEENRLERVPNVSNYEIYIDRIDEMIDRKKRLFLD